MLLDILKNYSLILASTSPRRRELLKGMGIDYTVELSSEVEENYPPSLPVEEIPTFLAGLKSHAFPRQLANSEVLITADTIVVYQGQVLGKPAHAHDANRMLQMLAGNRHQVLTGVCVRTYNREKLFTAVSTVTLRPLSSDEISYYINTCRPFDKAGAYGVQEWIGYVGITHIEGSYFNVMGLPTQQLYEVLENFLKK